MTTKPIRCAVYTRKSSEEGLDQSFNSIDAQREACEAYVLSQRHEGWTVLPTLYDDGGFSGGSLDRPAVQRLLADIRAGLVDLVVVYKIDRLTRSLADFAKMVEVFDAHGASFVSVTQHFNTSSSMGRLTLNVLLSFAQFEREVTGERIRDKIAASKKRGMWMGGSVPLGYRPADRTLEVIPEEAALVRRIFQLYLECGSVREVQVRLQAEGCVSKSRTSRSGKVSGGKPFMRGALYQILKNRLYLGEIPHRKQWYQGLHAAILEVAQFEAVQKGLAEGLDRRNSGLHAKEPSLLTGWIHDERGFPLTPSHALKEGRRYRYYVSRPQRDGVIDKSIARVSLPAHDVEQVVVLALARWLTDAAQVVAGLQIAEADAALRHQVIYRAERYGEDLRQATAQAQRDLLLPCVRRIQVNSGDLVIELKPEEMLHVFRGGVARETDNPARSPLMITVIAKLKRLGMEMRLVVDEAWAKREEPAVDAHLVLALARGHQWWWQLCSGEARSIAQIAERHGVIPDYVARVLRAAMLAPDLVERALEGEAVGLNSRSVMEVWDYEWQKQRTGLTTGRRPASVGRR